ncbi:Hypothetical protein FKW44_011875, partial [Caligus rogercresseyi]
LGSKFSNGSGRWHDSSHYLPHLVSSSSSMIGGDETFGSSFINVVAPSTDSAHEYVQRDSRIQIDLWD